MDIKRIELSLIGESPLLMHSDKLADPLHPKTIEHKKLTSKRNKSEEDYALIAKSEWMAALYFDKEIGVYVPGQSIQSSIWGGAKLHKLGKKIQRGVMVTEEKIKLIYDGPVLPADMWMSKEGEGEDVRWTYRDARSVIVGAARLMRYRPRFDHWSVDLVIEYDTNMIDEHELLTSADSAGKYIGIGDFRRDKGGMFGCFSVKY